MGGEVARYLKEVFREIAEEYEFRIDSDGSNGRSCACIYRSAAVILAIGDSADTKEHIGEGSIQEIPEDEEDDVEWEDME